MKYIPLFYFFFLLSCSSSDCKRGGDVDIFYLFDVSKPHLKHVNKAVSLSGSIYSQFNGKGGIRIVTHKSSTIDRISFKASNPCEDIYDKSVKGKKLKPVINEPKPFIDNCLKEISNHKGSSRTDIYGSIYYASNILQSSVEKFGKVLIIFSDFEDHADTIQIANQANKQFKDNIDLTGIDVLLYFSETNPIQGTMIAKAKEIEIFAKNRGARSVKLTQLSSIGDSKASMDISAERTFKTIISSFLDCDK